MTKTTINVKIEGQNISILKIRLFFINLIQEVEKLN